MKVESMDAAELAKYACEKFKQAVQAATKQVYRWRLAEGRAARAFLRDVPRHTRGQLKAVNKAHDKAVRRGRDEGWSVS
jgi:hypothetical protein